MARRTQTHAPILSRRAPRAIGPYAPAVRVEAAGPMLFISAQIPIEMPSGQIFLGAFKRQAELALGHVRSLLQDGGLTVGDLVKVTCYLTDMAQLAAFNDAYTRILVGLATPARAVVGVTALPGGVAVAVEAWAIGAAPAAPAPPAAPPEDEYDDY